MDTLGFLVLFFLIVIMFKLFYSKLFLKIESAL